MAEKVTTMVLKVDLQCHRCYKKIKKLLCKFIEIRDQKYDEKANTVTVTVVSSNPEKIRDKLRCKGGALITSIEIVKPKETPKDTTPKPPVPGYPLLGTIGVCLVPYCEGYGCRDRCHHGHDGRRAPALPCFDGCRCGCGGGKRPAQPCFDGCGCGCSGRKPKPAPKCHDSCDDCGCSCKKPKPTPKCHDSCDDCGCSCKKPKPAPKCHDSCDDCGCSGRKPARLCNDGCSGGQFCENRCDQYFICQEKKTQGCAFM